MLTAQKTRVFLVDDHTIFRQVMRSILRPYPNFEVVGEANDGDEAVGSVGQLKPTVVLMDIRMPKMDGVTAARLIKIRYPDVVVLGLSANAEPYDVFAMQKAGAFDVLSKEKLHDLPGAIQRAVAASKPVLLESTPSSREIAEDSEQSDKPTPTISQSIKEPKV
jgi:DNA-binding NarL/FixJ family response regulator